MIPLKYLIIFILIFVIIMGIFYQYNYDNTHCKQCLENMTNYTYDLIH
jgi:hypothetical protein